MKIPLFRLISLVVVLGAVVYGWSVYNTHQKALVLTPGATVAVTGTVVSVSNEQVTYDGPYLVVLQPKSGASVTIAVPSMGLPFCPAYKANNIGDVNLVAPGQEFEARGEVSEHNTVIPCEDASHYFRPTPLVVTDFEGEADPARMSLTMKSWQWVNTSFADGRTLTPKSDAFAVTFAADGRFSVKTDCNSMGGSYAVGGGNTLALSDMFSTKMYCEGSQETEFAQLLSDAQSFEFTSKGELRLMLKAGGVVIFK